MNRKQKDKKQKLSEFGEGVWAAEKLLKKRKIRGQTEYLVKWKGWSDEDNTWEPVNNIIDKRLIKEFEQRKNKNEVIKSNSKIKKQNTKSIQSEEVEKNKLTVKEIKKEEETKAISILDLAIDEKNQNDNLSLKKNKIDEKSSDEAIKILNDNEKEELNKLKVNLKKNKENEKKAENDELKVFVKENNEDNKAEIKDESSLYLTENYENCNETISTDYNIFVTKKDTEQILDKNKVFEKLINVDDSLNEKKSKILTNNEIENEFKVNPQDCFISSNDNSLKNKQEDNIFLTDSSKNKMIIDNSSNWHSKNIFFSPSIKSNNETNLVPIQNEIKKNNSNLNFNLSEKTKKEPSSTLDKSNKTSKNNYVNLSLLNTDSFSYPISTNNLNNYLLNNNINYYTDTVNDKFQKSSNQKLNYKVKDTINCLKINEPVNYLSSYSSNELEKKNSFLISKDSILQKNTKIKSTSLINSSSNQFIKMNTVIKEDTKIPLNSFQQANPKIYDAKQQTVKRILPPPDFWKKQNSLINQIIVTDVTNDKNELITIRECRTPKDFFKKSLSKKKKISNKKIKLSNKKIRKLLKKKKKISLNC